MIYLNLEQVLIIHELQINEYGGSHGLRDKSLLESAIYRPQTTFGGQDLYPTIFFKAAVLTHSLMKNHPFVDGNKRTATASMLVFLELNNYKLIVPTKSLTRVILDLELGKINAQDLSTFLKSHSKKIEK